MTTETTNKTLPDFCWKVIGTMGDSSCNQLPELGHCRHCRVYSESGKKLFDRDIPQEYREEWKLNLAQIKEEQAPDLVSLLVFRLHDEWLALKTIVFHEVTPVKPVHSVPSRSNRRFRGVVNINGEMLLCVSLEALLGLENHQTTAGTPVQVQGRMVVIGPPEGRFVFAVDEISGVQLISPANVRPAPSTISESPIQLVKGVFHLTEQKVGFLDEEKLLEFMNRSLTS
jgi:chemotaxis-related protein WspD